MVLLGRVLRVLGVCAAVAIALCGWFVEAGAQPASGGDVTDTASVHVHTADRGATGDNTQQAFYIAFADQLGNASWVADKAAYSLFITCPQNVTGPQLQRVRAAIPGARLLAYWDFGDVPLRVPGSCSTGHVMGDKPGRNCTTSYKCGPGNYTTALQASEVKPSYLLHELHSNGTSSVVCLYPGLASYVWFKALADAAVDFLAAWLQQVPFDGVYLDGFVNADLFADGRAAELKGMVVDSNGDGQPDSYDEIVAQYTAWAPYMVQQLRQRLGDTATIVANSAGALSDPSLNGITVEMEACLDPEACMDAVVGQAAVSVAPLTTVMWLTHSEAMPPAQQCAAVAKMQAQLPYVFAGTDFFDGSHVVCNKP